MVWAMLAALASVAPSGVSCCAAPKWGATRLKGINRTVARHKPNSAIASTSIKRSRQESAVKVLSHLRARIDRRVVGFGVGVKSAGMGLVSTFDDLIYLRQQIERPGNDDWQRRGPW